MSRTTFKQLLKKYVSGNASEEEKALIDHWYELLYNDSITRLTDGEFDTVEQEMWNKISEQAQFEKKRVLIKSPIRKIILRWVAAAAIFIALSFGIYTIFSPKEKPFAYLKIKEQHKLSEVVNISAVAKEVRLEDGTVITLKPDAKLAYPKKFSSDKREVYLEGEAFLKWQKIR